MFKNALLPKKVCMLYSGFVNTSKYGVTEFRIIIVEKSSIANCRKLLPVKVEFMAVMQKAYPKLVKFLLHVKKL